MLYSNARVFVDRHFRIADLEVNNGIVTSLTFNDGAAGSGLTVLPGLFDIHTHGCLGHDFSSVTAKTLNTMLDFYRSHGVTHVLATLMTNPLPMLEASCKVIEAAIGAGTPGLEGINLEGPFLSPDKKGAHDGQYLLLPDINVFNRLQELSGNSIRVLTVAPELDGAMSLISSLASGGRRVRTSLGHSACDYSTAMEAFGKGADHVTHLYNAMNGFNHRAPAIPGAAMDSGAYVELICDGLHVHESVIRQVFKAYPGRVVMISDSINPTGLSEGQYTAGGLEVFMHNGDIRLADGTLAGSSVTLLEELRRCIKCFGIPEEEAVAAATLTPAASLGMDGTIGSICVGMPADFIVVDEQYNLLEVCH